MATPQPGELGESFRALQRQMAEEGEGASSKAERPAKHSLVWAASRSPR